MNDKTNSYQALIHSKHKVDAAFVGLKCPVCGKNLMKVRKCSDVPYLFTALLPEESENAVASVKCPCHGGAIPINVIKRE